MNELGIAKFLREANVGDEIFMATHDHEYSGKIKSIHSYFVDIEDGNLSWYVNYRDCYLWYLN
jgi:hypothetical protein